MSYTIDSPFKVPPSISPDGFVAILEQKGSFDSDALWEPTPRTERPWEARRIYSLIASRGHDPAVWLALLRCSLSMPAAITKAVSFVSSFCRATRNTGIMVARPAPVRVMNTHVFQRCHHLKILKTVVITNLIDVMDNLITVKRTLQVFFHDVTMFKYMPVLVRCGPIRNIDPNIPICLKSTTLPCWMVLPTTRCKSTGFGTESSTPRVGLRRTNLKSRSTMFAGSVKTGLSRSVEAFRRAIFPTSLGYQIFWFLERGSACQTCTSNKGDGTLSGHRNLSFRCRAGGVSRTVRHSFSLSTSQIIPEVRAA